MHTDSAPAEGFEIQVEYPRSVRQAIRRHAAAAVAGATPLDRIFDVCADEASIGFEVTEATSLGEQSGMVHFMVLALVIGVPQLLRGESFLVHGWYQSFCFEPDLGRRTVHMSRGMPATEYQHEREMAKELGVRVMDVTESPRDGRLPRGASAHYEWRRLEKPIAMARFVDQCLAASRTVIAVYTAECPPQALEHSSMRALISADADAREAWEASSRTRSSG